MYQLLLTFEQWHHSGSNVWKYGLEHVRWTKEPPTYSRNNGSLGNVVSVMYASKRAFDLQQNSTRVLIMTLHS